MNGEVPLSFRRGHGRNPGRLIISTAIRFKIATTAESRLAMTYLVDNGKEQRRYFGV